MYTYTYTHMCDGIVYYAVCRIKVCTHVNVCVCVCVFHSRGTRVVHVQVKAELICTLNDIFMSVD